MEMTEAEKARLAASNAAISDLAGALLAGDREGGGAAFAAVQQTNAKLDREALRDKIHMPVDAGEYEAGLRAIMARIPDGWGRWISASRGWYPILIELDQALAAIDPGYEVHQVKEKFGTLRYYFRTERADTEGRMDTLVREAEKRCETTCELCGDPGVLHARSNGWLKTVCPSCAAAGGYERISELVNDLTPERRGVWRVTDYAGIESIWDLTHGEVTIVNGDRHREVTVLAPPSVLRQWRLRLADGNEIESEMVAAIERIR